jgi:tetratricopeptide (TPR) repeat protein
LRGLLCRCSPKSIADQIFWTSASLRTQLSRGLYNYIAILTNQKQTIWYKIADDLEELGYKRTDRTQQNLNQILFPMNDGKRIISAFKIISVVSQLNIDGTLLILDAAVEKIDYGDKLNLSKKYSAALEYYYLGLKLSNSVNVDILMNIARCYEELKMYDDSLLICHSTLSFISDSAESFFERYKIYVFISSIFDDLAITHKDIYIFKTAIKYYELAAAIPCSHINSKYLLSIWNQISLILHFVKNKILDQIGEEKKYLDMAEEKMELLLEFTQKELEAGSCSQYRRQILKDMQFSFDGLGVSWQNQYDRFEEING